MSIAEMIELRERLKALTESLDTAVVRLSSAGASASSSTAA